MRSFGEILGQPALDGVPGGVRAQPNVMPVPNTVPAGAQTGAPPRVQFFSRQVNPGSVRKPTLIAAGTPENRVITITTPAVGFTVYLGDESVTTATGMGLPPGQTIDFPLVGLQAVYAVTDSPTYIPVQVCISIVLMAEQARPVGRIGGS